MKICPKCMEANKNLAKNCEKCGCSLNVQNRNNLKRLKRPIGVSIVSILLIILSVTSVYLAFLFRKTFYLQLSIFDFIGPTLYLLSGIFMLRGQNRGRQLYIYGMPVLIIFHFFKSLYSNLNPKWLLLSAIIYIFFLIVLTRKNIEDYFLIRFQDTNVRLNTIEHQDEKG